MRDVWVSVSGIMLKDCTKARKANFSLSVVVDVSFDIDERASVNIKIASFVQHCEDER
jgi:hypothetical protein